MYTHTHTHTHTQKSIAFLYANNELSGRECKKKVPIKIAPKKNLVQN